MSDFRTAPIACTDFETTGLDQARHEIIEIGLVVVEQPSLRVIAELDLKARPEHIETAEPKALEVNGYRLEDWHGAVSQEEAARRYAALTGGAMLLAHNMAFERSFLQALFRQTGVADPMDYHRLDLFSLAWGKLRTTTLQRFNLNEIAKHLGIGEEPMPHRAINGARKALEVYRMLMSL